MQLGFVGLGAMGLPMTRHLLEAGHQCHRGLAQPGPDRRAWPSAPSTGDRPAGVADAAEVVFLCVPSSPQVVEVVAAMLPVLGPGTVVVDCSTIDPEVTRDQHALVTATGAGYLDAPLSGGTAGAEQGTLTLMVGGDEATLGPGPAGPRRRSPGASSTSGGPGMGQVVKLCNNLIYAAQMLATAEATALALKSGVDMAKLLEVLTHATGDCVAVRTRLPVAGVVPDEPGLERVAAGLHDRPDGQGPRPGPGLRAPGPACRWRRRPSPARR